MSATSNYLINKFKEPFGQDQYLVIRPIMITDNESKAWSYDEIDTHLHYDTYIFIGINQVKTLDGCYWLCVKNKLDKLEYYLRFKFDWKSFCKNVNHSCWKDFKSIGIHLNDLNDKKYDALCDSIFSQLCEKIDLGYDIGLESNIVLFEKNNTYKMLLERDLCG